MTSYTYTVKHGHFKLFKVPDRSIFNILYATRGVKKYSSWRLWPKLGPGCVSFTLTNSSEGLISNPCAYLSPKSITPVSPQQVSNKLACAKVCCACCVVLFPKLHYNDLLTTVGNFPVYGEVRGNACNGFWTLLQQFFRRLYQL